MFKSIVKSLLSPFIQVSFERFMFKCRKEMWRTYKILGEEQTLRLLPWIQSGFDSPAPNIVKWQVMSKWGGNGTWIETGTYLGETTRYLSRISNHVVSLEPADQLYVEATIKLKDLKNVKLVHGSSETSIKGCIENLDDSQKLDLNFWLDGHYSVGFTYLGESKSPVLHELEVIGTTVDFSKALTILIDDVRGFSSTGELQDGYPSLTFLVEWADMKKLRWMIEHDIFIMTNRVLIEA